VGDPITLEQTAVAGVKADFVKHRIRITIDLPLTDETIRLRERLVGLANMGDDPLHPVEVTLQQMKMHLDTYQPGLFGDLTDRVTLSTNGDSAGA
jgi:hypothetical protein